MSTNLKNSGKSLSSGKWHENVDSADLSTLTKLAVDINDTVDQTVKHVAKGKIKVGKLLLEARTLITDDQAFGTWRKENTLVQSKQHAHYLMQIADRFGDAEVLINGANYSVMQELVLAEQQDIQWVEKRIEAGDPPKVAEVRAKVKLTQAERLAPKELKGTSKKGMELSPAPVVNPNANLNEVVQMSLTQRVNEVKGRPIDGIEGALIVLGLDPDPQCPCHPEVLDAAYELWSSRAQDSDEEEMVDNAYEVVTDEFKDWG